MPFRSLPRTPFRMPLRVAAACATLAGVGACGGARGASADAPADAPTPAPAATCEAACTLEVRNRRRAPIDVWVDSASDPSTGGAPEFLGRVEALRTRSFRLRRGDARVRALAAPGPRMGTGGAAEFAQECQTVGTSPDGTRTVACG